jgi:hypothetical protein
VRDEESPTHFDCPLSCIQGCDGYLITDQKFGKIPQRKSYHWSEPKKPALEDVKSVHLREFLRDQTKIMLQIVVVRASARQGVLGRPMAPSGHCLAPYKSLYDRVRELASRVAPLKYFPASKIKLIAIFSRFRETWVVVQYVQKTSALVIPKPGLSARNLLFFNSGTADSSRDSATLRNDRSFNF